MIGKTNAIQIFNEIIDIYKVKSPLFYNLTIERRGFVLGDYILLKDIELHGQKYRFAIFDKQENGVLWYYTAFAEIFEEDDFELIHGGQFKTLKEAENDIKALIDLLIN
ncbi:hypothetical protein [Bacillus sp. UMB0728]|uniref:hypothetical protein n=1 Tax=Bacillus sp. UMB0728 TaxID=2066052 RepID=UPI000C774ED7|nr:hypothetical protein [Bacillus sp. UMB0728]PLR70279.1 hypothetical protein CYJ37_24985 [Bacillus sp. UMB0728]